MMCGIFPGLRIRRAAGLALTAVLLGVVTVPAANAATLYVDSAAGTDSGNCQNVTIQCQTITYALTQAVAGDTVAITAGNYPEQIVVDKSVTIEGTGPGVVISSPATLTNDPAIPLYTGVSTPAAAIVTINNGAVVTIHNLEVAGPGPANLAYGVFVGGGANATLDGIAVSSIRTQPIAGNQTGKGIGFGAIQTSQWATGSVVNSRVDDFQKTGISVSGVGTNVTVKGNTISGSPGLMVAQNGIDTGDGALVQVLGNTITGLQCTPANSNCGPNGNSWSTGIIVYDDASGSQFTGNDVSNSDAGIQIVATTGNPTYTFNANVLTSNLYVNMDVFGGTVNLVDNEFVGSVTGLEVDNFFGPSTVNLNGGNIIRGAADEGIYAYQETTGTLTVQGSGNQFYGNGTGAYNDPASVATMNLTCNWWGDASGPNHTTNPTGTGNPVTDAVTFAPWSVDNTTFACSGQPGGGGASTVAVPVDSPWALGGSALLLALLAGFGLRQRREPQRERSDG